MDGDAADRAKRDASGRGCSAALSSMDSAVVRGEFEGVLICWGKHLAYRPDWPLSRRHLYFSLPGAGIQVSRDVNLS